VLQLEELEQNDEVSSDEDAAEVPEQPMPVPEPELFEYDPQLEVEGEQIDLP